MSEEQSSVAPQRPAPHDPIAAGETVLLIDPKGDLTNLCLTFPNLAPTDFEPWVNEGDAAKAGQTVPEFAAAQAAAWTDGLAGWNLHGTDIGALRSKVDFTVYTPGSTAGVGLNIVGSLQAPADLSDAETVGDEIDGFVSGLLSLVGIEADPLSSREHILLSNLIMNEWSQGRSLDLPTLVGMALTPPIRKLGVFEIDKHGSQPMKLIQLADGVTVEEITAKTEAPFVCALR